MTSLQNRIQPQLDFIIENASRIKKLLIKIANGILIYLSTFAILLIIYKLGFPKQEWVEAKILSVLEFFSGVFILSLLLRFILTFQIEHLKEKLLSEFALAVVISLIIANRVIAPKWFDENMPFLDFLRNNLFLYLSLLAVFLAEISQKSLNLYTISLNPARIFIYSFLLLIFTGAGLLLLPRSTVNGISIIDALFTSTSAVCVTGLTVIDTASQFTNFGKFIIFFLFQTGGLGIMTFTSFFGFLFKGEFSFNNELFLQSLVNEEKMGEIFKTILKIILTTFGIELAGAFFIYLSIPDNVWPANENKLFFVLFHSVSAFCNAGFSILPDGLFNKSFRFNYNFQIIIAFLIILGGLGFPIVFNVYRYIKHFIKNRWNQLLFRKRYVHVPRIINLNTKLVAVTTLALLLAGMMFYLLFEWDNTLKPHSWNGKIVTAFFGSVTPRTAGFNTIDIGTLLPATILIYLFLMWIGASPGSTGGGVKTTTFAIAILNCLAVAKGKDKIELYKREIAEESIKRSLTIIFLSIIFIGLAILLLTLSDPEKPLIAVVFECFSAFSTVGLTLGITPSLTPWGKMVIIVAMLIGRVGTLTIIIAFFRKTRALMYRYPKENIFIN